MILIWNGFVGATYGIALLTPAGFIFKEAFSKVPLWILLNVYLGAHCFIGLVQMLYPIGGLLADIRCGRYRIITLSLFIIWSGSLLTIVIGVAFSIGNIFSETVIPGIVFIEVIGGTVALLAYVIGFSGFQSNIVQFGLDQLLDASSEELSLFLHWLVWTEYVGGLIVRLFFTRNAYSSSLMKIEGFLTIGFSFVSVVFVILGCCKRQWFHCERTVQNPYHNLFEVLKFTARHSKPVGHRSALTFSDDVQLSRMDLAKRIYGGPFATEVVEDVKTCLRILVVMLTFSPILSFEVPTSFLFPLFGVHVSINPSMTYSYEWMLFQTGNLSDIISVVWLPLYIILVCPHFKQWIPRILYRMGFSIVLTVASVAFMFIIQGTGNYLYISQNSTDALNKTCIFLSEYRHFGNGVNPSLSPTLQLPSQILLILNLLNGIAAPLLTITVLEFISAQSPHTMKGLLVGVFYAFRGVSIILGSVLTFPFMQNSLWAGHNGVFDCGLFYYLCNTVLGVAGLLAFVKAARWYRYRERDDPPYGHQYAEEYYSRYIGSVPTSRTRLVEDETQDYGAIDNKQQ